VEFFFSDYTLDVDRRELRCSSALIDVEPQVFDLLRYLVQNRDRVVSKDDLVAGVWDGRPVADSTIASRINAARKALRDSGRTQTLIRTIPRKGVRFVGDVRTRPEGDEPAAGAVSAGTMEPVRPALRALHRPAVAVLPFVNMSDDPEQEHFSNGISEDIITALAKLRSLSVSARCASFSYKGRSVDLRGIGKELGVGYLVGGSVRKSGHRVRITAQLTDVTTGIQVWGERFDRGIDDAFAADDEITDAIVATIEPQVYAAENYHAQRKPPEGLDAWDLTVRALSHFWRLNWKDNLAAQTLLKKAVAINPKHAQALAVLSFSHSCGAHMGWEERASAVASAEHAALAAIRADDEDPWAHLAAAFANVHLERVDDALAAFEAALRLNPNFPLAHGLFGLALSWAGRWQEGGDAARRALRLSPYDPFSAIFKGVLGYTAFVARDYDDAMRWAREGIRQRADFAWANRVLVAAAAMKGDTDAAEAALRDLRRTQPNISLAWLSRLPYAQAVEREHYLEAFGRAGLD
jgi:TolB-like protein/cytochrome c-type biogenesis protein CcmH/NrfG